MLRIRLGRLGIAFAAVVAVTALAVGLWLATPLGPDARAVEALAPGDGISVAHTDWGWEFWPSSSEPATGVVIYPGGRVDPRSYAPLARGLAQAGYRAIIVKMPANLAVLAPNAADCAIEAHPKIQRWAIVGHSLGGAMAAAHVAQRPGRYAALVLLAAYPPSSTDLSQTRIAVVALAGNRDTVLDTGAFEAARSRLPRSSLVATVEGANHAQWGSYGRQRGDSQAAIPPEVQEAIAVDAVRRALGDVPRDEKTP
ncbi:alpha/beta hydrolase [Coriobacteriia bacterium Es71-Z0120]|uniref:alpha/beta fold hydrolase n=1 Tax=Parvivirga hydrogeniphila TaxID=2939460 RepID=UPI002260F6B4|nr:alpha/beta fold hydrolase [Parvivirga hydrogeniphila]MCL4078322.1 alpha/beta hydrolase [Parvivirga hydrogeniphila]